MPSIRFACRTSYSQITQPDYIHIELLQDTYCVTVVMTKKVKVSNHGWFFRACRECNLKAEGKVPPYICKKGHQETEPLIKYDLLYNPHSKVKTYSLLMYMHLFVVCPMFTGIKLMLRFLMVMR
jgi:hypothetical protein